MMISARTVGATLLVSGLGLVVACSSSSDDPPLGGAGAGASSGGGAGDSGSSDGGSSNPRGGRPGQAGSAAAGTAGSGDAETGGVGAAGGAEPGAGGEAGGADACAACKSGLCTPSGECVECLAGNDQCAVGTYCGPDNTCVSGCKDDDSCASGVCGADHNCQSCIGDQECSGPQVCGNNQCADACTAAQEGANPGCGTGLTCCSLHCVDASTDSLHCGACGTACGAGQLCGIAGCTDATLAAVCSVAKVAVVLDNSAGMGNWAPTRAIAEALRTTCTPAPTVREISEDVADVVNAKTGRPVAGGDELLIAAGGSFFARLVDYVSTEPVAPIYSVLNVDTLEYRNRSTGKVVASEPFAEDPAHDFFVVQLIRDSSSGSLILNAQGFWQKGTAAAADQFQNALLPVLNSLDKAWYLYEWTDANANGAPDAGESVLIDSGN